MDECYRPQVAAANVAAAAATGGEGDAMAAMAAIVGPVEPAGPRRNGAQALLPGAGGAVRGAGKRTAAEAELEAIYAVKVGQLQQVCATSGRTYLDLTLV